MILIGFVRCYFDLRLISVCSNSSTVIISYCFYCILNTFDSFGSQSVCVCILAGAGVLFHFNWIGVQQQLIFSLNILFVVETLCDPFLFSVIMFEYVCVCVWTRFPAYPSCIHLQSTFCPTTYTIRHTLQFSFINYAFIFRTNNYNV